jgi:hypothetical protein
MPPKADTAGGALHVADCMVLDGSYWDQPLRLLRSWRVLARVELVR